MVATKSTSSSWRRCERVNRRVAMAGVLGSNLEFCISGGFEVLKILKTAHMILTTFFSSAPNDFF